MVQSIAISEKTTLKYLREHFGLERTSEADFFPEWRGDRGATPEEEWPDLTEGDRQALARIRNRYFHQLDEGMMLE